MNKTGALEKITFIFVFIIVINGNFGLGITQPRNLSALLKEQNFNFWQFLPLEIEIQTIFDTFEPLNSQF